MRKNRVFLIDKNAYVCYNTGTPKREAVFTMIIKKKLKFGLVKLIFGLFLVMIGTVATVFSGQLVHADSVTDPTRVIVEDVADVENETDAETDTEVDTGSEATEQSTTSKSGLPGYDNCKSSLGEVAWQVCPMTNKIAEATDWLYEKIEDVLVINPVPAEDGSPIFEIWKYCRGLTNIVFIIFLLVVIYSQITGFGISNYGIKRALPKLIVAAIMVNLSFLICSLAVDVSNVIGNGLRGLFSSVAESAIVNNGASGFTANGDLTREMKMSYAGMYDGLATGIPMAVGAGVIAIETGAIWLLIPTLLGAIVAVVTGLITIALRQAVVMLLIMVSPLAMVANILPNTESLFKRWKDLLKRMLVFYPMFSLLFGGSQLAGFAIIASAKDGFGLILGMAVQIFPLFFSWKLMQMSGTFLGDINAKMRGIMAKPVNANRAWAESRRQLTKQKYLASGRAYTPSLRLMQFLSDRKIARELEIEEHSNVVKTRGAASRAFLNYNKKGNITRRGQRRYEEQARTARYQQVIEMDKDNYERGLGGFSGEYKETISDMKRDFNRSRGAYSSKVEGATLEERLEHLDKLNVDAFDSLRTEKARGLKIQYDNTKSYFDRVTNAWEAKEDLEILGDSELLKERKLHGALNKDNLARYHNMHKIMESSDLDFHFAAADAAHTFGAQAQIMQGKFKDYFALTVPTQDVVNKIGELTKSPEQAKYIDPIISGLRVLNARGDTDLLRKQVSNMLDSKGIELGTYASQSLASFLQFEVKGSDPFLRRFGKYINLETARMFDNEEEGKIRRRKKDISIDEYIDGEYIEEDEKGHQVVRKSKKGAAELLQGTSFKDMERTSIKNMTETIREYAKDKDGNFDFEKFKQNEKKVWDAIMPNIISDQFSFLSGSEQIIALSKGLTGMNSDGTFDWKGIFGKENVDKLSAEQKAEYFNAINERTGKFLKGHVPSQIARSKSDILGAVEKQFALKTAIGDKNAASFFGQKDNNGKTGEQAFNEGNKEKYNNEHIKDIRKLFRDAYGKDALKGFLKMYKKGYQGDAKEKLIKLLDPEGLYKEYFSGGENERQNQKQQRDSREEYDDDDEDGKPFTSEPEWGDGATGNRTDEAKFGLNEVLRDASNEDFWKQARGILKGYNMANDAELDDFERSGATDPNNDKAVVYNNIINKFFNEN